MNDPLIDFTENESWFDRNFVTECQSENHNKKMACSTCHRAMEKVCAKLQIPTMHKVIFDVNCAMSCCGQNNWSLRP